MEYPDYLRDLMKELNPMEFLKVTLKKLDEISITTEEELLLLDKILYKSANISKECKMKLLTPELQEKFYQCMEGMKLDQTNFLNMLKPYEHGTGPYTKQKPDISRNPSAIPDKISRPSQEPLFSKGQDFNPENPSAVLSSEKSYGSYGSSRRSVERGGMTPKRARSNSSSSSSSSSEDEKRTSSSSKFRDEISRTALDDRGKEKSDRIPSKYSFKLKAPDSLSGRNIRGYEPRSERGEESSSGKERDFRRSPEYHRSIPSRIYRGSKKIYKPPSFKH